MDANGKKVGMLLEAFEGCDEEVTKVVRATKEIFEAANLGVQDISVPMHAHGI